MRPSTSASACSKPEDIRSETDLRYDVNMKKARTNLAYDARVNSDGNGHFQVRLHRPGESYSSEMNERVFGQFCARIGADPDVLSEAASQAVTVVDDIDLTSGEVVEFGFAKYQ
jgi:hypothetical protein